MLLVYAPLLEEVGAQDAVRFLCAVVDFSILAIYKSYNNNTLRFITLALFRINQYKEAFRPYCALKDSAKEDGHFNFLKFYAITHYT